MSIVVIALISMKTSASVAKGSARPGTSSKLENPVLVRDVADLMV